MARPVQHANVTVVFPNAMRSGSAGIVREGPPRMRGERAISGECDSPVRSDLFQETNETLSFYAHVDPSDRN